MGSERNQRNMSLDAWRKAGLHMPDFMRDFHDQKELFKTIEETYKRQPGDTRPDWVAAHIYTVDIFLWFMAARGYTLQRTRRQGEYRDVVLDVMAARNRRAREFDAMLREQFGESND